MRFTQFVPFGGLLFSGTRGRLLPPVVASTLNLEFLRSNAQRQVTSAILTIRSLREDTDPLPRDHRRLTLDSKPEDQVTSAENKRQIATLKVKSGLRGGQRGKCSLCRDDRLSC